MNKNFNTYLEESLSEMINTIKILLYKQNQNIFDILDFENDNIYSEPLLYAFFNNRMKLDIELSQIICGYQNSMNEGISIKTDIFARVYIPNIGWFKSNKPKKKLKYNTYTKTIENALFESPKYLKGLKIEMLHYPIDLLKQCYYDSDSNLINVEIENISKRHIENVTKAYHLIKEYTPSQYALIEKYASKFVIFNTDTYLRNSFADITAHGIAFYNAYQEDYDEVFFVDDIAHQTGHIILNTLLFNPDDYFEIDKNTILETIKMPNSDKVIENRNLFVIYHALYTYYTSFMCLDACIENNVFQGKQLHEAKGRISFYINKCYRDMLLIDNPINSNNKSNEYFTDKGYEIYVEMKNMWNKMYNKWYSVIRCFEMSNQPYNFTYSKFLELNPLPNV